MTFMNAASGPESQSLLPTCAAARSKPNLHQLDTSQNHQVSIVSNSLNPSCATSITFWEPAVDDQQRGRQLIRRASASRATPPAMVSEARRNALVLATALGANPVSPTP